jgi:biopolymer transport protein ExbB/TolQ
MADLAAGQGGGPGRSGRWGGRRAGRHLAVLALAILGGVVAIWLMQMLLPQSFATVLLDRDALTYPLTVQNVEWLAFAIGLGELALRIRDAAAERRQLAMGYLPEDERTIVQAPQLRELYARARAATQPGAAGEGCFLPRLIQRVILQFQASRSVDQANALLNSSLDLCLHEIDLRYSMIRYVIWAIPTLGFLGTVLGISIAVSYAGAANLQDPTLLSELTRRLAVAFDTTLLALMMSAVLVLVQHVVQAQEEGALNQAGQYLLDNLINRLYEES